MDLQLSMQSVPITTKVVSSNPAHGVMYSIVELNIHSAQLGKVGKYQRGKLGTVAVCLFVCLFNNISAIPWRSVLLVEETGGPEENHRFVASH